MTSAARTPERFGDRRVALGTYLDCFASLADARRIIGEFTRRNTGWLMERVGHRTLAAARIQALVAPP
jgi:hypothetical protein